MSPAQVVGAQRARLGWRWGPQTSPCITGPQKQGKELLDGNVRCQGCGINHVGWNILVLVNLGNATCRIILFAQDL